jgi:hypothetical protein
MKYVILIGGLVSFMRQVVCQRVVSASGSSFNFSELNSFSISWNFFTNISIPSERWIEDTGTTPIKLHGQDAVRFDLQDPQTQGMHGEEFAFVFHANTNKSLLLLTVSLVWMPHHWAKGFHVLCLLVGPIDLLGNVRKCIHNLN